MVLVVGGLVDWMDSVTGRSLTVKQKQEYHKLGVKLELNVCFNHFTKLSLMPCVYEKLLMCTIVDLCTSFILFDLSDSVVATTVVVLVSCLFLSTFL